MRYPVPIPKVASPFPAIDPVAHREPFIRILSELFHAEKAALEGFKLLADPSFVREPELFRGARSMLVRDEQLHLDDIEEIIRMLGADGVLPNTGTSRELWETYRNGTLFALPYRSSVAAILCLYSEGLGYAVLHHLAQATTHPEIKQKLERNLCDEENHLRVSIATLRRTLKEEGELLVALDLIVHTCGFVLLARAPIREQKAVFAQLGWDLHELQASCFRFVTELLALAMDEAGYTIRGRNYWAVLGDLLLNRTSMRLAHAMTSFPEPPLARRAIFTWGWLRNTLPELRTST